jgi:hypothetical protein
VDDFNAKVYYEQEKVLLTTTLRLAFIARRVGCRWWLY